jgi:site-specific recombinase XerD
MSRTVAPLITDSGFHTVRPNFITTSVAAAREQGRITHGDAQLLTEFITESRSTQNISLSRVNKIVSTLLSWRRFIGPYAENSITDLYTGIESLKVAHSARGIPYKQNTIGDFVMILKQFYRWLIENEHSAIPEKKVVRIRPPSKDTMTKVAADLLTPDEITALIKACRRTIDRALVTMLYEGGFRIGEIGTMRWGSLTFDQYGVVVNVNFKTNKPRYIRLIMCREYLAQWRADYRGEPEGEALVFLNAHGRPLQYETLSKRLKSIARDAGITRHITPHIFRHSRITHLIREGVPESVIKLMMWGSVSTKMFQTYAHLTGADIDAAMLERYGIAQEDEKVPRERGVKPVQCPHCHTINPPGARYCAVCGRGMTLDAIDEQAQIQQFVADNPELLRDFLDQMIRERGRRRSRAPAK